MVPYFEWHWKQSPGTESVNLNVVDFFWGCGFDTVWWQVSHGSAAGCTFLVLSMPMWQVDVTQPSPVAAVACAEGRSMKKSENGVMKIKITVVFFMI
jgi:hypothetical protein